MDSVLGFSQRISGEDVLFPLLANVYSPISNFRLKSGVGVLGQNNT